MGYLTLSSSCRIQCWSLSLVMSSLFLPLPASCWRTRKQSPIPPPSACVFSHTHRWTLSSSCLSLGTEADGSVFVILALGRSHQEKRNGFTSFVVRVCLRLRMKGRPLLLTAQNLRAAVFRTIRTRISSWSRFQQVFRTTLSYYHSCFMFATAD